MMKRYTLSVAALVVAGAASMSFGDVLAPQNPYVSFGDSPFLPTGSSHWLEDFESNSFDSFGVTSDVGHVKAPSETTDSVDFDDSNLDGWGNDGHSFVVASSHGQVTFTFDAAALGHLPTYAGAAWTDSRSGSTMTFQAFDAGDNLIGSTDAVLNAGPNGSTDEDVFFGVENAAGIKTIVFTLSAGGFELDHLQYGFSVVPVPAPLLMGLAGLGIVGLRRRNRAA